MDIMKSIYPVTNLCQGSFSRISEMAHLGCPNDSSIVIRHGPFYYKMNTCCIYMCIYVFIHIYIYMHYLNTYVRIYYLVCTVYTQPSWILDSLVTRHLCLLSTVRSVVYHFDIPKCLLERLLKVDRVAPHSSETKHGSNTQTPTPWKMNGWNLQITHLERKMIGTKPPGNYLCCSRQSSGVVFHPAKSKTSRTSFTTTCLHPSISNDFWCLGHCSIKAKSAVEENHVLRGGMVLRQAGNLPP